MTAATLASFLAYDGARPQERWLDVIGAGTKRAADTVQLPAPPGPAFWGKAAGAVGRALHQALEVDLTGVLVAGWNTYSSLLEYTDRSKHPPQEEATVALGEHTITSTHQPRVEVFVGPRKVAVVEFTVELELNVQSVELKIRDAKIWEVAAGKCTGKGVLKCAEAVLLQQESGEISLPGRIVFEQGIPLAPAHRPMI